MIPLKDENPAKTFPLITVSIILANILVFIYEMSLGSYLPDEIKRFAVIPYNITHLKPPGALVTLITSLFFHANIMHIFGNMLYLWIFGNNIEDRLGHIKFIFFYLLCGILATFGHIITGVDSRMPLVGASGAISGVLGAYLILYPNAKILTLLPFLFFWQIVKIKAIWFLLFWIILQLFNGAASQVLLDVSEKGGVAWFAHISGFFSGIVLLRLFLGKRMAQAVD